MKNNFIIKTYSYGAESGSALGLYNKRGKLLCTLEHFDPRAGKNTISMFRTTRRFRFSKGVLFTANGISMTYGKGLYLAEINKNLGFLKYYKDNQLGMFKNDGKFICDVNKENIDSSAKLSLKFLKEKSQSQSLE